MQDLIDALKILSAYLTEGDYLYNYLLIVTMMYCAFV